MTNQDAAVYLCSDSEGFELESDDYESFYGVLFQLKVAANSGGVLGLLWMRENGNWRIVSYEVFES